MSRDSSGNYTLPGATNPVVSGTTIDVLWGNGTITDIATALTASLDRDGQGGMRAPLKGVNGSAAAPAFSFTSEGNSGWYRQGTNTFRYSVASTDVMQLSPTGLLTYKDITANGVLVGISGNGSANSLLDTGNVVVGVGSGAARVGAIVNADQLVYLVTYKIVTVGTTDWTLLGAASNTVGVIFQANDDFTGLGTGTAYQMASYNTVIGSQAGALMAQSSDNTLIGSRAAAVAVDGSGAVVIGKNAAAAATNFNETVIIGAGALELSTAMPSGVTIGSRAMPRGSAVSGVVAVGDGVLGTAYGISGVVALGSSAMAAYGADITAGSFIVGRNYWITAVGTTNFVAIGAASNTVGVNFIATGVGTGTGTASSGGVRCTGVGNSVQPVMTDANDNTAFGFGAHPTLTTGLDNTALGSGAGSVTTGSNNLELATTTSGGASLLFNVAANSNRIVMGNNNHTNAYVKVSWTVTSDERDKVLLGDVPLGLLFVMGLRPIRYRFKESRQSEQAVGPVRYGFSAQQVVAAELAYGDAVIVDAKNLNKLQYTEANMIPVLVNAIQQLARHVADLQLKLASK